MSHYYDGHKYTDEQAKHAVEVLLDLMKNRRFFLYNGKSHYKEDYCLNPQIFHEVIDLDLEIRRAYRNVREQATARLIAVEQKLGVTPATVPPDRRLVDCNRYTGGFDICQVYPLTAFAAHVPASLADLTEEIYTGLLGGRLVYEVSPNTLEGTGKQRVNLYASQIWHEFDVLDIWNPTNVRSLILLKSRFDFDGCDKNNDFAGSRVADIQKTPFALGYLFWKFSQTTRIVPHNYVVFGTSRESHVRVEHWSTYALSICFKVLFDGFSYDSPVMFVTAL